MRRHKKRTKSRWNPFLKQLKPLVKSAGKNDEKFCSAIKTWQEVRESRQEKINAYYSGSSVTPFGRTKDMESTVEMVDIISESSKISPSSEKKEVAAEG